jgi:hypothetical protein
VTLEFAKNALRQMPTVIRSDFEDGQERMRDVSLATMLDYAQPLVIRKLIGRYSGALGVISTAAITPGAAGGRPGTEYWLTEEQCYFIAAKSETANATAILKRIIHVFIQHRKGKLVSALDHQDDPIMMIRREQLSDRSRIEALESKVALLTPAPTEVTLPKEFATPDPPPTYDTSDWLEIWRVYPQLRPRERGRVGLVAKKLLTLTGRAPSKRKGSALAPKGINRYPRDVIEAAYAEYVCRFGAFQ